MKRIYISGIFACLLGMLTACYNEGKLHPLSTELESRYEFPEGDNSWDQDVIKISEDFNVFIIYKDIGEFDLNRTWVTGSMGAHPLKSYPLNDEQAQFNVNFMKDWVFSHLKPELLAKVLPTYIFLVYDMRQGNIFTDYGYGEVPQNRKFDGMDFWAFCLEGEDPGQTNGEDPVFFRIVRPQNPEEFWTRGIMILKNIVEKIMDNGNIVRPMEFDERFDYQTQIVYGPANVDDPNFYLTRGFPGRWNNVERPEVNQLNAISDTSPQINFREHILIQMIYTPEKIAEVYADYPEIIENMKYIADYMKRTYDWDITAMSRY